MRTKSGFRVRFFYEGLNSTCIIEKGDDFSPLAKATVKRYAKDVENRSKGRFLALTKAVQQLDKADRYEVWESYRTATKNPRWANACTPKNKN